MSYEYQTRTVTHGNDKAFFIPIQTAQDGTPSYSTPYEFTGLTDTSMETAEANDPTYADNQLHVMLRGVRQVSGSATAFQIRQEFAIQCLGKNKTSNGSLLDNGQPQNFAWIFSKTITNEFGQSNPRWFIYPNVQASPPSSTSTTDTDSVTPESLEIPMTANSLSIVTDVNNQPITEIIWDDQLSTGLSFATVSDLVDSLFAATNPTSPQLFMDYATGKTNIPSATTTPTSLDTPTVTATPADSKVTLTWSAISGATNYNVEVLQGSTTVSAYTAVGNVLTYEVDSLTNGTEYTFNVTASDGSVTSSAGSATATPTATP